MYTMKITVDGTTYPVHRDAAHRHPDAVHAALGTISEAQLQTLLDQFNVSDWYDNVGNHRGPDVNGLEMFHAE